MLDSPASNEAISSYYAVCVRRITLHSLHCLNHDVDLPRVESLYFHEHDHVSGRNEQDFSVLVVDNGSLEGKLLNVVAALKGLVILRLELHILDHAEDSVNGQLYH